MAYTADDLAAARSPQRFQAALLDALGGFSSPSSLGIDVTEAQLGKHSDYFRAELLARVRAAAPPDVTTLLTEASANTLYPTLAAFNSEATTRAAADTALSAGPVSTAQSIQFMMDSAGVLEIIPVMRWALGNPANPTTPERLGLWYSTDGLKTLHDLYPGDLFTPPTGGCRDPSLLIREDAWFVAYTAGNFGYTNYWGLAKSTNRGRTWTHVANVVVPASVAGAPTPATGAATWGPSFFQDPRTGKTHVIISISTGGGNHIQYLQTATSNDLSTWSNGSPIAGSPQSEAAAHSFWDGRMVYAGGYYYFIVCYDSLNLKIYRSTAVDGSFTLYKAPAFAQAVSAGIEQCQLHYLGAKRWRINYTRVALAKLYAAESWDDMATWQTPVVVLNDYSIGSGAPHQFSEIVRIHSRIADPLPIEPTPLKVAVLRLTAPQAITNATVTKVTLNAVDLDVGSMADLANNRLIIPSAGLWRIEGSIYAAAVAGRLISVIFVNGLQRPSAEVNAAGAYSSASVSAVLQLTAGDIVDLRVFHSTGSTINIQGDPTAASCFLTVTEQR